MSFVLGRQWLPREDLLRAANPDILLPEMYDGEATSPLLVTLFLDVPQDNILLLTGDSSQEPSETIENLNRFYAKTDCIGLLYSVGFTEEGSLDFRALTESLYLNNHYTTAAIALIQVVKVLRESPITMMTPNSPLPSKEDFDKFLDTKEWFLDENFVAPTDFMWNVSHYWERENIREALIATRGELKKIIELLSIGVAPVEVLGQVTGKTDAIPLSWMDKIMNEFK